MRRRRGGAFPRPRVPVGAGARRRSLRRRVRAASARVGLDPEGRVAFKQGKPRRLPYPDDFFDLVADLRGPPGVAEATGAAPGVTWSRRPRGLLPRARLPAPARRLARRGSSRSGGCGDGSFSSRASATEARAIVRLRADGDRGHAAHIAGQSRLRARADAEAAARDRAGARRSARSPSGSSAPRGLEDGVERALRAVEASEVPVVISGDGLVGAIGGAMAGSETPLGIIPGGRGNDLARVLGIPDDPAAAVAVLAAGETRRIDVGEANGKRFLGIVSVGFDSEATAWRTKPASSRQPGLRLRALSHPAQLEAGALHGPRRRASGSASAATRSRSPTTALSAAACASRPTPSWTTGARRRHRRRGRQAALRG